MRVFAYNDTKRLLAVELPIREIVAAGIDPWRVDMFDDDPVTMRLGLLFRKHHFRKLRDVSFAYKLEGATICIGVHDGTTPVCLVSDLNENDLATPDHIVLKKFALSELPFVKHLAEYLFYLENHPQSEEKGSIVFWKRPCGFFPKRAAAVSIAAGQLIFDGGQNSVHRLSGVRYVDNTRTDVAVACALPEQINMVFDLFAQWQPIVYGEGLRKAYRQEPFTKVALALDGCKAEELQRHLKILGMPSQEVYPAVGASHVEFQHAECKYEVELDQHSYLIANMGMNRLDVLDRRAIHSCERIYATRRDEIKANRLSLYDLANNQSRRLMPENAMNAATDILNLRKNPAGPRPDHPVPPDPWF